jgi:alkaline phosphatase D
MPASMTRREFLAAAAAFGATLAWPFRTTRKSVSGWTERRDIYPEGVASGDPCPESVILWTRRAPVTGSMAQKLTTEIANDMAFEEVVSETQTEVSAATDWTCRVLAANLKPRHVYWYRFTDEHGFGSRIGRTVTAPAEKDPSAVQFTFASCQNVNQGACNAYRRMIYEDQKKPEAEQIGFVMHLGDFIYELVWYPEDRPQGMYSRRLRDVARYKNGEKIQDFHIPTTVEDYRTVYRGYLHDPDLQDARARWPFVCMWDNHEFSWKGWQSQQDFGGVRPAQTRKVAANQAWFEYQPARVVKANPAIDRFEAPTVKDAPLRSFDEEGLGQETNNLAAINSLKLFRSFRYGRNVDLILTDNRSFRSEPVVETSEAAVFKPKGFPYVFPQDVLEILDAGRTYNNGSPPESIRFGGRDIPNPRRNAPTPSMLGARQKKWFFETMQTSTAPWKLWGLPGLSLPHLDFE